jgi:hypothetical protein
LDESKESVFIKEESERDTNSSKCHKYRLGGMCLALFVNPMPPFGTVCRFALKIALTREWHNLVKKMSGLSGLKTLEKENGFFGAFSLISTY